MAQEINLREYLDIVKRRKWIFIIIMIVCIGMGIYKSYINYKSYVPTYTSTITVRINTSKNVKKNESNEEGEEAEVEEVDIEPQYSTYNVAMNQSIASSYKSLATSTNVTNIIASTLGISSAKVGNISAIQREDMAEFIDISVVNQDKYIAKKVIQKVPEAFNQELIRLVGFDCVEVVYDASEATVIGRGRDTTLLKFTAIGLVISIFLALLRECLDTKIVTPDDVNKYWNYQLIGTIPLDKNSSKGKLNGR